MTTGNSRVIASVEARMSSSRLPGKMLMDIEGKPAIIRVLDRLKLATKLDGIVLATTVNPTDDELVHVAQESGYSVYRGSEDDVLGRVVDAQQSMDSEVVVEIRGDCLLIDPSIVDQTVEVYQKGGCDVAVAGGDKGYPQGMETEVFSLRALFNVAERINDPAVREHVSLYFFENPDVYKIKYLKVPEEMQASEVRLVLDYEEDLQLFRKVYASLLPKNGENFGVTEILELFRKSPEIFRINSHCKDMPVR